MITNDIFDQVSKLFALHESTSSEHLLSGFEGLLSPTENYVQAYARAALIVSGRVEKKRVRGGPEQISFIGSFQSIDDSGLTFFGPIESEEQATKRCTSFRKFIESNHPHMPSKERIHDWCKRNGCQPDFW